MHLCGVIALSNFATGHRRYITNLGFVMRNSLIHDTKHPQFYWFAALLCTVHGSKNEGATANSCIVPNIFCGQNRV